MVGSHESNSEGDIYLCQVHTDICMFQSTVARKITIPSYPINVDGSSSIACQLSPKRLE
jgi:hypothetical protein